MVGLEMERVEGRGVFMDLEREGKVHRGQRHVERRRRGEKWNKK